MDARMRGADLRSGGHPPIQKKENKIASKFSEVKKKHRLAGAKRRPAGASRAAGDFFKKGARFFTF
jgi:hypothetical protein